MSKWFAVAVVIVLVPIASHAQFGRGTPPPRGVAGHGVEVPGWWARLDNPGAGTSALKFLPDGSAIRATTGPAAIFWDPQQKASGEYTVTAKFTVNRLPQFEEGYGLFIGGTNLEKDDEHLTAFLVREDGSYAIRQRRGRPAPASQLSWTPDPALSRPDSTGRVTNELSIRVEKNDVVFSANGGVVTRRPVGSVDTDGIVGIRVADHLDIRIEGFSVVKS